MVITSSQQELLKYIALILMVLDHIGNIYSEFFYFKILGRVVYPIFAFILVYNYMFNTSDKARYMRRMLMWAFIAQPIYLYAFYDYFGRFELNILFTLFLGMSLIMITENKAWIFIPFVLVASLFTSYGVVGALLPIAIYFAFKKKIGVVMVLALLCLLNPPLFIVPTLMAIPIVYLVSRLRLNVGRVRGFWFYAFYPLHILIIKLSFFL